MNTTEAQQQRARELIRELYDEGCVDPDVFNESAQSALRALTAEHQRGVDGGMERAAKIQCGYCSTPDTFEPALLSRDEQFWHRSIGGGNYLCDASAIRARIGKGENNENDDRSAL